MKTFLHRTLAALLLIAIVSCAGVPTKHTSRNAHLNEIVGVWQVIQLPSSLQPRYLKEDPWPGECQYIAFYANGVLKVWNNTEQPCEVNRSILEKNLDQTPPTASWHYDYSNQYQQGVIVVTPGKLSNMEVWDPRLTLNQWSRDGAEFAPSELTIYMGNFETGRARILWIKHLRPVK